MILRYCTPWKGYCCQSKTSTADCCTAGVGFQWNNATWVNYEFRLQNDNFHFNLQDAFTMTSASTLPSSSSTTSSSASTPGSTQDSSSTQSPLRSTASCSTTSSGEPTVSEICSTKTNIALTTGLGVGLGVPFLLALAALLWLIAARRYLQTGPRASSKGDTSAYEKSYNDGYSAGIAATQACQSYQQPVEADAVREHAELPEAKGMRESKYIIQ